MYLLCIVLCHRSLALYTGQHELTRRAGRAWSHTACCWLSVAALRQFMCCYTGFIACSETTGEVGG